MSRKDFTHNLMDPAFKAIKQIANMKTVQSAPTINKATVTLRTRFCNAGENTSRLLSTTYLALTLPSLTRSRSMQQQTQIYQLTNHYWTRLPVPSANYEMVVQPALVGFHCSSYSNVQLIRSRRLCTKSSSRSGEQDTLGHGTAS